jgi:hypothetical protein
MKTYIYIIILMLLLSFNLEAQQNKTKKHYQSRSRISKTIVDSSKIVTKSSDCKYLKSDSCNMQRNKGQCRMKDQFIDKDGDGINDNRCKGMGLGCKKRNLNCGGKK